MKYRVVMLGGEVIEVEGEGLAFEDGVLKVLREGKAVTAFSLAAWRTVEVI